MRTFVPATIDDLRRLQSDGRLVAPVEAFAATSALRVELSGLGEEEAEYALTTAAAESSYDTLAGEGDRRGRRVVVVAEVPEGDVASDGGSPGVVRLTADIPIARVDAILADPRDVDLTRPPAEDLAWYATQELAGLLA
ncbi:MAG: DUF6912 family protein [Nocardioidaceae bacterium]